MAATVITFANLGTKTNIPSADIAPVLNTLIQHNALDLVICQVHQGFPFRNTVSAVPAPIRFVVRRYETYTRRTLRTITETLFDWFAQWKVRKTDTVIFHGGFFLPRTLRRARALGATTVDLTRTAHPNANATIESAEYARLGIPDVPAPFTAMAKRQQHHNEFDFVVALSEFVKEGYEREGYPTDRIAIAYPDVDLRRFTPRIEDSAEPSTFRLVYAAYTGPLKGLGYLLEAWESLALADAELALVGGYGDMPKALKERYDAIIARNPSITWVGHTLTPEDEYCKSTALVFPSLTEGFGRVTLEAMACGIPVITTENARGIVEDGKSGFVVPIRDSQALAEKIRYLYDHRDEALQMGREARRAVERKKPFGDAVYEIYEDIMQRQQTQRGRATLEGTTSPEVI
jgi:glycosyltransferase involved in cell wall biosynthesis